MCSKLVPLFSADSKNYLVLEVVGKVDLSNVLGVYLEEQGDGLLAALLEMGEELDHLLLVVLSWFLADHYPLLDYHLDIGCHLKRGVREINGEGQIAGQISEKR